MDKMQELMERNPEAGAMALGMDLLAQSMDGNYNIMRDLYEYEKEQNAKLRREIEYLTPLAENYLQIVNALPFARIGNYDRAS